MKYKSKILYTLIFMIFFLINDISYAVEEYKNQEDIETIEEMESKNIDKYIDDLYLELEKIIPSTIYIEKKLNINTDDILNNLLSNIDIENLNIKWIIWNDVFNNNIENYIFKDIWENDISINIELDNNIVKEKTKKIFVYQKSIWFIYSDESDKREIDRYINDAVRNWIYLYEIGPIKNSEIEITNILNNIKNYYKNIYWKKSDFLILWWSRDFIFNILWKINREVSFSNNENDEKTNKLRFVSVSNYNINILDSYIQNFLANKDWIEKIILTNQSSKHLILSNDDIKSLEIDMDVNKYDYINVNLDWQEINNFLFISKFINNLNNIWFSYNWIYIILIIPFIITFIIIFKHFIWLSPIWMVVPLFLTILIFKLWFILTFSLLFTFLALNILIHLITKKYTLLYLPKISFFITINIVFFIFILNTLYSYNLIPLNINDVIYFIIFIIVIERFINIIASKDLIEYKQPFFNTILISIVSFLILNLNFVKIIILAYPEFLMALIPINFMIWRFTWLRVTEYFRFKEVIKNIEE